MNPIGCIIEHALVRLNPENGGFGSREELSGAALSFAPSANTLYVCKNVVTSLELSSIPNGGLFEVIFISGAEPTEITLPETVLLPDRAAVEANTIYDMSIRCETFGLLSLGLAAVQGWALPEDAELPVIGSQEETE